MRISRKAHAQAAAGLGALAAALLAACDGPKPRSFNDFLEDPILREGAIARCNQDRQANLRDIECANARRAAAAVAVREERERQAQLERESERKLEELRRLVALQQQREREAAEAAKAAAETAYELQWREGSAEPGAAPDPAIAGGLAAPAAPSFGAPTEPAVAPAPVSPQAAFPAPHVASADPQPAADPPAASPSPPAASPPPPAAVIPRPFRAPDEDATVTTQPIAAAE